MKKIYVYTCYVQTKTKKDIINKYSSMYFKLDCKKNFLIPSILLFISCNVTKNGNSVKKFKENFKFNAYCICLLSGYNNKNITSEITRIDKSFY